MYLPEGAHEWLADIELLHERHRESEAALNRAKRTLLKAPEGPKREKAQAKVAQLQQVHSAAAQALADETALFFEKILRISKDSIVVLRSLNGQESDGLVATHLSAHLLADGTGVFSAHGSSMKKTLHTGVPDHVILTAREAQGQRLVALA